MEQTKLVQVRVSQETHSRLAAMAKEDRRSIAAEALVLLEQAVSDGSEQLNEQPGADRE